MNNIDKDLVQASNSNVIKKRKNPLPAILLLIIGVAVATSTHWIPGAADSANLASGLMMAGWCLALWGAIRLVINLWGNSWEYIYKPTGERLHLREFSYETAQRDHIRDYVNQARFDKLATLPRSNISAIKVTLCTTKQEILWAQVFEFIPHEHVPITEILAYNKGTCPIPANFA